MKYSEIIPFYIRLNSNCPESEKNGTGPGSCSGSSNKSKYVHSKIARYPNPLGKSENGLEFQARLWKIEDPEIYDMIKTKVESSPEYSLFNKLNDNWLKSVDPQSRDDAIDIVNNNKLLKSYLLHEHFGLDIPEKVKLYRVGPIRNGMTNSFFPNRKVAESYQKRMGVESIHEFEANTNDVVPSLSGAGEIWVPGDVEDLVEIKQD